VRINAAGRELIKRFEALRLEAYLCPAGVWTIGWGHTGDVKPGQRITEHQAEAILDVDLDRFERRVAKVCPRATENQFSACVSLAFNIGEMAFQGSTLARKLNAGDVAAASSEFPKWNKSGGKVLPGLIRRRAAERALFDVV